MKARSTISSKPCLNPATSGFTLLELLASMAILSLMMVMLFAVFQQTSKAWLSGERHIETFTQARAALDLMSRELSQAIATDKIPFFAQEDATPLGTVGPITLHLDNLAFVASVGDSTTDGLDLMEIVYRLSRVKPPEPPGTSEASMAIPFFFTNNIPGPYQLIRRASGYSGVAADCRNYGLFTDPGVAPWDFYGALVPNPNWPETSDRTRTAVLAENVVSLRFQFYDATTPPNRYNYWNSTGAVAWQNELATPVPMGLVANMQNRAPAQVVITLRVLDSKAAARYKVAVDPNAKKRIYQESYREFTTSIAIPNRQP